MRASALHRELDTRRRNMQLLEWETGSLNTLQLASQLLPQSRSELVKLMADHKVCVLVSH